MTKAIKILALKELDNSQIKLANSMGAIVSCVPAIKTEVSLDPKKVKKSLEQSSAFVFTSFQAVNAISSELTKDLIKNKTIFCVGDKTKNYFKPQKTVELIKENDAQTLSQQIIEKKPRIVTHFHGSRYLDVIERELSKTMIPFYMVEVYKNQLLYPLISYCENFDIILFFSPSGVESFLLHNDIPKNATLGVLGSTTAAFLNRENTVVASKPMVETLIEESINHYYRNVRN